MPFDIANPANIQEFFNKIAKSQGGKKGERKKMTIAEARAHIEDTETERLLDNHDIPREAVAAVEESGISPTDDQG